MASGDGDETSTSPAPPPPFRHVATAFVSFRPDLESSSETLYALVKRSEAVSTYKGKWGAVSGGIEDGRERRRGGGTTRALPDESPEQRAATEVSEEVGIERERLAVECRGRPIKVDDEDEATGTRRRFVVHPVRFRAKSTNSPAPPPLTTNWESSEAAWLSEREIEGRQETGDAVPLLLESLGRTFPPSLSSPAAAAVSSAVRELTEDRARGASQLARVALGALADAAEAEGAAGAGGGESADDDASPSPCPSSRWELCADWGFALAASRPSMSPLATSVASALARARETWESGGGGNAPSVFSSVALAAREEEGRLEGASRRLARGGVDVLKEALSKWRRERAKEGGGGDVPRIVTNSFSSAVRDALSGLIEEILSSSDDEGAQRLVVAVCEGRPLCEGARLAEALADAVGAASSSSPPPSPSRITIELCTDAAGPAAVRGGPGTPAAAAVVVGADAVFPEKADENSLSGVVNKVGTRALVEAAAGIGVPAFALAGRSKVAGADLVTLSTGGVCRPRSHEECSGEELLIDDRIAKDDRIVLRNVYFESVPLELFERSGGGVLVEGEGGEGPNAVVLAPSRVRDLAREADERAIAAFGMDWL